MAIDFGAIGTKINDLENNFSTKISKLPAEPTSEDFYNLQLDAMKFQLGVQTFSNSLKSLADSKKEVTRNFK